MKSQDLNLGHRASPTSQQLLQNVVSVLRGLHARCVMNCVPHHRLVRKPCPPVGRYLEVGPLRGAEGQMRALGWGPPVGLVPWKGDEGSPMCAHNEKVTDVPQRQPSPDMALGPPST